jgi:hypothetical protein
VIWLPRSSITSPQTLPALKPDSATAFSSEAMIFVFSAGLKSSE